ncbi:hypothetical protein EJF18_70069 [Clavispora lusitaniae]|uniref:Uncharacterized protein n=1 Tax=Clavispora lusitaniae TaxID=36911 RepID=A0ACD0WSK0_CLALS|nr:hypothetical protein EJF14_70069 [Clavispora lusitaniae]QFZ35671.1 hypothetical protein EJF16_70069 [Clavispora lusitaniae]QFZ41353.1 hypothetical protein EJF15_70069 [Clavispora lusitaniae]QFZ47031.1 hypothetical protein EJF18_70069 [Clavispora lusitaniae]QFZ52708.1 hypothetical protein EJF17_70069 [Clavispora lusitaniae]
MFIVCSLLLVRHIQVAPALLGHHVRERRAEHSKVDGVLRKPKQVSVSFDHICGRHVAGARRGLVLAPVSFLAAQVASVDLLGDSLPLVFLAHVEQSPEQLHVSLAELGRSQQFSVKLVGQSPQRRLQLRSERHVGAVRHGHVGAGGHRHWHRAQKSHSEIGVGRRPCVSVLERQHLGRVGPESGQSSVGRRVRMVGGRRSVRMRRRWVWVGSRRRLVFVVGGAKHG